VKLKLEFIVLNQLLTLVKRGMAPCNLPALAGDSKGSSELDPEKPADSPTIKALPERNRFHFIPHSFRLSSKSARSEAQSTTVEAHTSPPDSRPPSAKNATMKTDDVVDPSLLALRSDSDQTLRSDETDLIKVVGIPDEDSNEPGKVIDDIERQYLGRYGM
jgi:hypothetical protein